MAATARPSVWVQAEGERNSYGVGDQDVTTNSDGLRYGADLPLGEVAGGQVFGGLDFGVSTLSSDIGTNRISANISTNAYDVTLGALWVADSLFYIDSQIRRDGGQAVDADGSGYGISVEIGKPFTLLNDLTLIPQMQVMYSDIDMDNVAGLPSDQIGPLVDDDTWMARVGRRAERALGNNSILYAQIDLYHTFDTEISVMFSQNTVLTGRGQNTAALSIGGDISFSAGTWDLSSGFETFISWFEPPCGFRFSHGFGWFACPIG